MSNITTTYWDQNGKHQDKSDILEKFIPNTGKCKGFSGSNKKLDKLRRATNVYYDLYNNGLFNRAREFKGVYDFAAQDVLAHLKHIGFNNWENYGWGDRIEESMDSIIMDAWDEQKSKVLNLEDGCCERRR